MPDVGDVLQILAGGGRPVQGFAPAPPATNTPTADQKAALDGAASPSGSNVCGNYRWKAWLDASRGCLTIGRHRATGVLRWNSFVIVGRN